MKVGCNGGDENINCTGWPLPATPMLCSARVMHCPDGTRLAHPQISIAGEGAVQRLPTIRRGPDADPAAETC
eukprot:1150692-Pelagomonas_calceolata.AAC.5